jgi:outer membrane protein OmpA-like peptidoglycan-associated protein
MRTPKRLVLFLSAAVLLLGAASEARAQGSPPLDRSFDIQLYEPAIGVRQLLTVETARVPSHLGWGVGAHFGYMNRPLSVYLVDSEDNLKERYPIVGSHVTGYVYGFFGFLKRFQVGLGIPVYWQSQEDKYDELLQEVGGTAPGVEGAAMGDLRLQLKSFIYGFDKNQHNLAASVLLTFPVFHWAGQDDMFTGDQSVNIWPRLIYEFRWRGLTAAANVGFLARVAESQFLSTEISHAFTWGAGGSYKVVGFGQWSMDVMAEIWGRNGLTDELDANPVEVDLAVRFRMGLGLSLYAGGGAGLIKAVGSPKFRVFAGVQFSPAWEDKDEDGVPDYQDKCPGQKEDKDGFQDEDGCPDEDNDKDGIKDADDKCPDKAEDYDRFEDKDGCPEPDNDGDGIPDKQDNCPMDKGPAKDKGCPANMLDADGDGVQDNQDKCKDQPEDKDGFQDEDGCPDPDNDGDGVPDEHDKCPGKAEDKDGNADADGCPDPDDDGDGVCDDNPTIQRDAAKYRSICLGKDKCPGKMETINGVDDLDGCPDRGKEMVKLDLQATGAYKGRFLLTRRFAFKDPYSAELTDQNKSVLRQLAHILRLRAARIIKKVAIAAFTDRTKKGDAGINITKAQAEAIREYLIEQGVEKDRLVAVPAGYSSPVCTKRYRVRRRRRRCRRKNRRVELYILKMAN